MIADLDAQPFPDRARDRTARVRRRLARAPRHGLRLADHRPRLPVHLHAGAATPSSATRTAAARRRTSSTRSQHDRRDLPAGPCSGTPTTSSPSTQVAVRSTPTELEAARPPDALRDHLARGPAERGGRRDPGARWAATGIWIGAESGSQKVLDADEAARPTPSGVRERWSTCCSGTASRSACSSCSATTARSAKTSRRRSSSSSARTPTCF